jgi:hypothetical protein
MPSVSFDLGRLLAGLTAEQKRQLRDKLGSEVGTTEADRERLRRERGEAARKRREARLAFAG